MSEQYRDVLLVDDDRVIRSVLADLLEEQGFRVRHASSGVEALQIVKQECPYIVITDWVMSAMDGLELCRSLRAEKLPHYVYVVLLTTKSHVEDVVAGLSAGADEFLTKPVRRVELFARLQTGLRILELEDRLNQLATRDTLTGLLNRRSFCELFTKEWERATRHDHPLSCVMVDVDFFKRINDVYGHLVGDRVLANIAECFEQHSRGHDYICRWGGEEFCVLLPETDAEGALAWANRCRSAIAATATIDADTSIAVTASFGVCERNATMPRPESLIGLADAALLTAKQQGRNCVVSYEFSGNEPLQSVSFSAFEPETRAVHFENKSRQPADCCS